MKFFLLLFLSSIFVFLSFQAFSLYREKNILSAKLLEYEERKALLEAENRKTLQDIRFYSKDKNAAKESVSQFNYRRPDEKLYILVPNAISQ